MNKCSCTWQDLVKWVMPYVTSPKDEFNGAPEPMVEAYIRRVANDFAHKTGVLRQKYYADIDCGVYDYPIDFTRSTELVSVKKVTVNERELDKSEYFIEDDKLLLAWKPNCDIREGLCVEYSYAPCTEGSCEVPEGFCTRYREAIINGAISHLLDMPSMDWYAEGASNEYRMKYLDAVGDAKSDIRKRRGGNNKSIYNIRTRFIQ